MVPVTRMMIGVLTVARAHSAALICAPVLAVTVAPPVPPVALRPKPIGVLPPGVEPPLLLPPVFTVIACVCVERVPQLLVYVAVAEHDAVGTTDCVRDVPDVPQPVHDQLPPEAGVGAKFTVVPDVTVAFAVFTPLITGTMV